jgi:hypothetical protein
MAKEETNVLRIRKGDYKENIRTHKKIRLDHTNKQGDKGYITTDRYYKLYKIPLR